MPCMPLYPNECLASAIPAIEGRPRTLEVHRIGVSVRVSAKAHTRPRRNVRFTEREMEAQEPLDRIQQMSLDCEREPID